jgi:DNA polymerase-3 subunit gamma/tau
MKSCADESCKKLLRMSSGIIKHFVKEIYGIESKIAMKPCDRDPVREETPESDTKENRQIQKPADTKVENAHPADSCIANQTIGSTEYEEIDGGNILEDPFVKKAGELFEPSRIIVKSKV